MDDKRFYTVTHYGPRKDQKGEYITSMVTHSGHAVQLRFRDGKADWFPFHHLDKVIGGTFEVDITVTCIDCGWTPTYTGALDNSQVAGSKMDADGWETADEGGYVCGACAEKRYIAALIERGLKARERAKARREKKAVAAK